jgi:DNA-binding response OmpR family regulator
MGTHDYVTIPFNPRELVARVRTVIRRTARCSPEKLYAFDGVMVDFLSTEVTRCGLTADSQSALPGRQLKAGRAKFMISMR